MKTKDERKELEKLIKNSPDGIDKNVPNPSEDIPELAAEPLMDVDFTVLKERCELEARVMINNAIAFMLPPDMIENNEYLQNKLEVDIISLSGMIYQLRTNEVMQKALIDQVNAGMVNPRMFEVFGQLSKIIGELNKQLIQTVEAIKETYKTFKSDIREQRTEALGPQSQGPMGMITTGEGGVITRGTKELIRKVKSVKEKERQAATEDAEDVEFIDDAKLIPDLPI